MSISALPPDLCLAYANTLFWRGRAVPTETLHTLADLLGWLETSAGINAKALRPFAAWSRKQPKAAARLLAAATALREALYRIFSAIAADSQVLPQDFAALRHAVAAAPARSRLSSSASGCAWELENPRPSVPHLLAPVLWSAGDLITGGARYHVRRCTNDACLWLFLDESKNATRRWCDMASCGNRAKARRHYLRAKHASS